MSAPQRSLTLKDFEQVGRPAVACGCLLADGHFPLPTRLRLLPLPAQKAAVAAKLGSLDEYLYCAPAPPLCVSPYIAPPLTPYLTPLPTYRHAVPTLQPALTNRLQERRPKHAVQGPLLSSASAGRVSGLPAVAAALLSLPGCCWWIDAAADAADDAAIAPVLLLLFLLLLLLLLLIFLLLLLLLLCSC